MYINFLFIIWDFSTWYLCVFISLLINYSKDHHQDKNVTTSDSAISDVSCASRKPITTTRRTTKPVNTTPNVKTGGNKVVPTSTSNTNASRANTKPSFGFRSSQQQQKSTPSPISRLTPGGTNNTTSNNSTAPSPVITTPQKIPRVSEKKLNKSVSSIAESRSRSTTVGRSPASTTNVNVSKPLSRLTVSNRSNLVSRPGSSSSTNSLVSDTHSQGDALVSSPIVQELLSGVRELAEQLELLRGTLEEQQKVDAEKDQVIERLTQEVARLRKQGKEGSVEGPGDLEKEDENKSSHKKPTQRDRMINAAAQTDYPSVCWKYESFHYLIIIKY